MTPAGVAGDTMARERLRVREAPALGRAAPPPQHKRLERPQQPKGTSVGSGSLSVSESPVSGFSSLQLESSNNETGRRLPGVVEETTIPEESPRMTIEEEEEEDEEPDCE